MKISGISTVISLVVKIEFVSLAMMSRGNKISSLEHVGMMMTIETNQ